MRCDVCEIPIDGWYYHQPIFGDYACASCASENTCRWCGRYRPTSKHFGEPTCAPCISHSLRTESDVRAIKGDAIAFMRKHIGPNSLESLPIRLGVEYGSLPDYFTGKSVAGLAVFDWGDNHVRLLAGMPYGVAFSVLCHEYGHMVLNLDPVTLERRSSFQSRPPHIEEGFCRVIEAASLLTNTSDSARWASFLLPADPDPIYGDGFRLLWPRALALGSLGALLDELIPETHSYRGPSIDEATVDFEIPEDIAPLVDRESGISSLGILRGKAILKQDLPEDAPVGPRLRGKGTALLERPKTPKPPTVITGVLRGSGLSDTKSDKPKPEPDKLRGTGVAETKVPRPGLRGAGLSTQETNARPARRGILRGRGTKRKRS